MLQVFEHFSAIWSLLYTRPHTQRKRLLQDLEEFVVGRKLIKMCAEVSESEEDSASEDDMIALPSTVLRIVYYTRYLQRNAVPGGNNRGIIEQISLKADHRR